VRTLLERQRGMVIGLESWGKKSRIVKSFPHLITGKMGGIYLLTAGEQEEEVCRGFTRRVGTWVGG